MLEKQIAELQAREKEHRRELNSLAAEISELKVVVSDCSKKCEFISRFDEFKDNQVVENQKAGEWRAAKERFLGDLDKKTDKIAGDVEKVSSNVSDLRGDLSSHIYRQETFKNWFDTLNLPSQIALIKRSIEAVTASVEQSIKAIMEKFAQPFEKIAASHTQAIEKAERALKDSSEAKEVTERLGVEHKVLNRKMNDILGKVK